MDMSHEHIILSALTALRLDYFRYGLHGLPRSVDHAIPHTFQLGNMTPFGSRLISEVWRCPSNTSSDGLSSTFCTNPDLSVIIVHPICFEQCTIASEWIAWL